MDPNSPFETNFEPRDDSAEQMFDPQFSPYCPGLILQPDEDPSSYNYVSAPEVGTNIAMGQFDMTSLSPSQGESCPLKDFYQLKNEVQVPAKKKMFIFQHLKALLKSFKQHSLNRRPVRSLHRVSSEHQMQLWRALRTLYLAHTEELQPTLFSLADVQQASLRERILTNFFSDAVRRAYNFLFCELIFASSAEELCSKTSLLCCSGQHTTTCDLNWSRLKLYTNSGLLKELRLEASASEETEWEELLRGALGR
jgi:hypothetical protein